jgi:hypothetical protein
MAPWRIDDAVNAALGHREVTAAQRYTLVDDVATRMRGTA